MHIDRQVDDENGVAPSAVSGFTRKCTAISKMLRKQTTKETVQVCLARTRAARLRLGHLYKTVRQLGRLHGEALAQAVAWLGPLTLQVVPSDDHQ